MVRSGNGKDKNGRPPPKLKLSPQKIAVIVGLLTNVLDVQSVLLDKHQRVEIVLEGSIRKKTKADRIVEELGDINVSDLIEAFIRS